MIVIIINDKHKFWNAKDVRFMFCQEEERSNNFVYVNVALGYFYVISHENSDLRLCRLWSQQYRCKGEENVKERHCPSLSSSFP